MSKLIQEVFINYRKIINVLHPKMALKILQKIFPSWKKFKIKINIFIIYIIKNYSAPKLRIIVITKIVNSLGVPYFYLFAFENKHITDKIEQDHEINMSKTTLIIKINELFLSQI